MISAGTTSWRTESIGKQPVEHRESHAQLLCDLPGTPLLAEQLSSGRLDAIVVPATRPASALADIIELAAGTETQLVVLCSRQAEVDQVTGQVESVAGVQSVVVQFSDDYQLPGLEFETSLPVFAVANGGRKSDLSVKRNFGLLLARLQGWNKIAFVDDDITLARTEVARLADQLDSYQIAGMVCRDFPDNSVFCHARRLTEQQQDVFVTGAALGVHAGDLPPPFFPDVYNEDWFFFGEAAARHQLAKVGEARQVVYDPYAEPTRASDEEFGDLLAEGLYTLIEDNCQLIADWCPHEFYSNLTALAREDFWASYIDVRVANLSETRLLLDEFAQRPSCSDDAAAAGKCLKAAEALYSDAAITAAMCVQFLDAWHKDLDMWNRLYSRVNDVGDVGASMEWLGVSADDWARIR